MPFYRIAGTVVHLKLGGKARKNPPALCRARVPPWSDNGIARSICCGISVALCDFPLPVEGGISVALCDFPLPVEGDEGATCSMPLCLDHAKEVGPGSAPVPEACTAAIRQELGNG